MKYIVECLVDEYVSFSAEMAVAKKSKMPNVVFTKKGQNFVFQSTKEYQFYARGLSGLMQMKKVIVRVEDGPEPKKDIEVTLADLKPAPKKEPLKVKGMDVKLPTPKLQKAAEPPKAELPKSEEKPV